MTHSRALAFVLLSSLLVGCTNSPTPPRSALLENLPFTRGIDESAYREPLSTGQLLAFVGDPDLTVPWGRVQQTLSIRAGVDKAAVEAAMNHMRNKYAFNKSLTSTPPSALPMDQVDVWLYMWNEPIKLVVSDMFHSPAGRESILVLVEKGHVIGTTDILFK